MQGDATRSAAVHLFKSTPEAKMEGAVKEDLMINWNKSKAGLWTTGGDPPGLYTTCLLPEASEESALP